MKDFTSQQREVVARKLGYDGPMQGFDEFLSSSPPLAMKYATITGKFAERMAKGGLVKMKRKYRVGGFLNNNLIEDEGSDLLVRPGSNTNTNTNTNDTAGMQVVVYGSDGKMYSTPAAAEAAGVTNYTMTPPANKTDSTANLGNSSNTNNQLQQTTGGGVNPTAGFTAEQKADYYNSQIAAGKTDAEIRAASGTQTDADWNYLTTLAARRPKTTSAGGITVSADVKSSTPAQKAAFYNNLLKVGNTDAEIRAASGVQTEADWQALQELARQQRETTGAVTGGGDVTFTDVGGKPQAGEATQVTAQRIATNEAQNIDTAARADETANVVTPAAAIQASTATTPTAAQVSTYGAEQTAGDVATLLRGVNAATGTVGAESQVAAQTMAPTSTAVAGLEAAQGQATKVEGAPTRVMGEGETISSAVDMAKAAETVAATQQAAAQGQVTEEMTVQGQLNKLMANFDAGNPPPWAAANLRGVTAVLAARGLGASSLAGQALIQATLEAALPIASADAQAYQAVASQNLSNRQQTAVLAAQQRAAFLGQEFDQAFQSRVTNAARVADVANMNFTAQQQIALENARLAQTMDLANMSNDQALVMANAAQIASLETTNLNNRQQAAVVNAQAFLQMDMQNLSNQQQTTLFKTQQMTQALLTDAASVNASRQFNAASTNQVDQFNNTLATQVSQFNASQKNAIAQFNVDQENALKKFNAEAQNQREVFNAQQRLVIDQANAQWQREISTANTAATNAANMMNAQLSQQMTLTEYNNEIQLYRDSVTHAWQSAENDANRATTIAASEIQAAAAIQGAEIKADSDTSSDIGNFIGRVLFG